MVSFRSTISTCLRHTYRDYCAYITSFLSSFVPTRSHQSFEYADTNEPYDAVYSKTLSTLKTAAHTTLFILKNIPFQSSSLIRKQWR